MGGARTKNTIFPFVPGVLEGSHESCLIMGLLLSLDPGGLPGGPFARFARLGCRSAICSDLDFFLPLPSDSVLEGEGTGLAAGPGVELPAWLDLELTSDSSSGRGVSELSSFSLACSCGVEIRWQKFLMKWAWASGPRCSWPKHFSSALKASMSRWPLSTKYLARRVYYMCVSVGK